VIKCETPFKKIKFSIERDHKINHLYATCVKIVDNENSILQVDRENYKYPIFLRNNTSDVYVFHQIIEKEEYNFIVRNDPKYIIDAGANIGMSSIYFANKYKGAVIIAIEPEESNYVLLKRNTKNYTNIITIKAALWNKPEEISLYDTNLGNFGFMVGKNDAEMKPSIKIKKHNTSTITIDEIIKNINIDFIDIIKIDIEGSEKEVFESCNNWITKTNCLIIELHERMKKGCNKAFFKNIKMFDQIGKHGENIYLSKGKYLKMK
jgi:FkbM family methyltransferase